MGKYPNFVNNENSVPSQYSEAIHQTVFKMVLFELLNQLMEVDVIVRVAVSGSNYANGSSDLVFLGSFLFGDGQMTFSAFSR